MVRVVFMALALAVLMAAKVDARDLDIAVYVNGERVVFPDQGPVLLDGFTFVPIRPVFEAMGMEVAWDRPLIDITIQESLIQHVLGQDIFWIREEYGGEMLAVKMPVASRTYSGRAVVPIRPFVEAKGWGLDWDGGLIAITYAPAEPVFTGMAESGAYTWEYLILHYTNIQRELNGLSPLEWCPDLARASRIHSYDMAENDFFSHAGSDGTSMGERARRFAPQYRGWGENIFSVRSIDATRLNNASKTVDVWMDSPGHRANILNPGNTHMGAGWAVNADNNRSYFTQKFGQAR